MKNKNKKQLKARIVEQEPVSRNLGAEIVKSLATPQSIQIDAVVDQLNLEYTEDIMRRMSPKIAQNGFIVAQNAETLDREMVTVGENWQTAAFIPGIALGNFESDTSSPCFIANTLNEGFVYAAATEDGVKAIGPVVTPCIVGNSSQPYGLYVPFGTIESVISGINFLSDLISPTNVTDDNGTDTNNGIDGIPCDRLKF